MSRKKRVMLRLWEVLVHFTKGIMKVLAFIEEHPLMVALIAIAVQFAISSLF